MVLKVIKHVMSNNTLFSWFYATSFAEARTLVENPEHDFFAALVDLNLPDAPEGEVVDFTLTKGIPTVVLTGSFDERRREKLLAKGIVDYVTKEGKFSYEYALSVLTRLVKNQKMKVLVVDDSDTARKFVSTLLRLHLFQVLEACDGVQAIKLVVENPDLKLLITDYNMPRMDGCELVKNIRLKYEKTDLVVIGLSSETEGALSARFIKHGANDFLRKPFNHEEFYCRVSHNVEFIELIESIRDASNRDDLTGAYNRKYFFECGRTALEEARINETPLSLALLDLDGFNAVNEQYGSEAGDYILKSLAKEFDSLLERFLYARVSGQQFCVLLPGLANDRAASFVEKVRQIICSTPFLIGEIPVGITFSAGVTSHLSENLDCMLTLATESLTRAKEAGGDLIFGDD